jgi:hypothetical protein
MPTEDAEPDIQKLGEKIQDLLITIQLPKFSERLTSQIQTVTYILKLVENAALFAEDCSKLDLEGECEYISLSGIIECKRSRHHR